jgi:predicted metal-dependent hydrolase
MTGDIKYTLRRNARSRSVRISIHGRDEVIVSAPRFVSERFIERFVVSRAAWIESKIKQLKDLPDHLFIKSSKKDFEKYKAPAGGLASRRLAHFNQFYGFTYKKISIRNQKTRWGSCSKSGTISFNYKIALLPPLLADYIIVHELCHIGEMNHSRKFWALVARTIPDYTKLRAQLNGKKVLTRG